MTWPTPITIEGSFRNPDGTPARGVIHFALSTDLVNPASGEIVAASLIIARLNQTGTLRDREGNAALVLDANDDPATTPVGTTYQVIERIEEAPIRSYSIVVPHTAPTGKVNLSDLVPVVSGVAPLRLLVTPGTRDALDVLTADPSAPYGYAWAPGGGGGTGEIMRVTFFGTLVTAVVFIPSDWVVGNAAVIIPFGNTRETTIGIGACLLTGPTQPYKVERFMAISDICGTPGISLTDSPVDMKPIRMAPGLLAGMVGVGVSNMLGNAYYLGPGFEPPTQTPTTSVHMTYTAGSFYLGTNPTTGNSVMVLCVRTGEPGTWIVIRLTGNINTIRTPTHTTPPVSTEPTIEIALRQGVLPLSARCLASAAFASQALHPTRHPRASSLSSNKQ